MEVKYQVFVSSTFKDLIDERKEVIQALLELDCIPVGMEMFPAADDDQWTLIKELIDNCDYYILIVGGRYGSLNKNGISYTQMEYEYALQKEVPIISFLPKSPDNLIVSKTDVQKEKLDTFKELAQQKMCKFYDSPEELGSVVSRSLVKLIKTKPRSGWVKANELSNEEANLTILQLQQELRELKESQNLQQDKGSSDLAQGNELYDIQYGSSKVNGGKQEYNFIEISWNILFSKTCTILIDEAKEEDLRTMINNYISHLLKNKVNNVIIVRDYFLSIIIQFKALGLIEKSYKNRSVKDTSTYWRLTNKGDNLLTQLRAVKGSNYKESTPSS